MVQDDGGLHSMLKHKLGPPEADAGPGAGAGAGAGVGHKGMSDWVVGLLLILLGTTVTSLAGVYSEWVLKNTARLPFFLQNMQMNGYGVLCNGVALVALHGHELRTRGILSGYNRYTVYTILCQASFGILTAAVFKYLDNITNVYKNATTMMITMVLSAMYLDFQPSITFVCGFIICSISLLLYNVTPEWLAAANKPAQELDAGAGGVGSRAAPNYEEEGTGLLEAGDDDGSGGEDGGVELTAVKAKG